jgi:Tfp pilus assembly protein PilP
VKLGRFSKTAVVAFLALGGLNACDGVNVEPDVPDDMEAERGAEAPPAAAPAAAPAPAPEATQVGAIVNEIDRHGFDMAARDPFTPPPPPEGPGTGGSSIEVECDPEAEPLGNYTLQEIQLLGLITGTPVPRAMFNVPSAPGGRAVIVGEGAKIGPRCGSRIADIRDNEVVVEQMSAIEAERVETILTLNATRIEAEIETTSP